MVCHFTLLFMIESKGHVTMITFNRGAEWQRLAPPTGSTCAGVSNTMTI